MPELEYYRDGIDPDQISIRIIFTERELRVADAEDIERWLASVRAGFYQLVRARRPEGYDPHGLRSQPKAPERPRPPAYDADTTAEDLPDPVMIAGREEASPRLSPVRILQPPDTGGTP